MKNSSHQLTVSDEKIESIKNDSMQILNKGSIGFEKESLRISNNQISRLKHPSSLGSALKNGYITTDFSEAQLELISPYFSDNSKSLEFLDQLHHFVSHIIDTESLWPLSMPPFISSEDDIKIASYGTSNEGIFKTVYRNGLANRYGKKMQTISGIHFNYSLPDIFWKLDFSNEKNLNEERLRSIIYFRMLRNIFRFNWLILYLFGASPIISKNFINDDISSLIKINDEEYYLPYATSLRMSKYGYQNNTRNKLNPSLESLDHYLSDLSEALNTNSPQFSKIAIKYGPNQQQLNKNVLQIPAEHYATARPKNGSYGDNSQIKKLMVGGVSYIELRSLDINPFERTGIDIDTINFLEVFLIFCLFHESKLILEDEYEQIKSNEGLVSMAGRDPKAYLIKKGERILLRSWGNEIFDHLETYAELMNEKDRHYSISVNRIRQSINDPNKTLSGKLLDKILSERIDMSELGYQLSERNKVYYLDIKKEYNVAWDCFEEEAKRSIQEQTELEKKKTTSFEQFLKDHLKANL